MLHGLDTKPLACQTFRCPFLEGADIHRPDTFQIFLEQVGGNMGNYIPIVPANIDVAEAEEVILQTRTIPAAILMDGQWMKLFLPLDRKADGSWQTDNRSKDEWEAFYASR